MSAQLITVKYNGPHNAYAGNRNEFVVVNVEQDEEIVKEILNQLTLGDYVLAKYKGKFYICEKKGEGYTRKELTYHPLSSKFTS